jgi:hypothetical protein
MSSQEEKRRAQVAASVARHRQKRDRLEVYLPAGWRERLAEVNQSENLSTTAWVRKVVAARIGEAEPS